MKKADIIQMQNYLDERRSIADGCSRPVDKAYYDGMVHAIQILGMDVIIKSGKHVIIY